MKRPLCLGIASWLACAGGIMGQTPSSPKIDKMTGEAAIVQASYRTKPASPFMQDNVQTPAVASAAFASSCHGCDNTFHCAGLGQGQWWFQADYLLWWIKPGPNPEPLLTTGSLDSFIPGLIGDPATIVLYGNESIKFGAFSGLQLTLGTWLDGSQNVGLEARGFLLGERQLQSHFQSNAQGAPFLLRPFINTQLQDEDVATVTFPDLIAGGIQFTQSSQLWGTEINLVRNLAVDSTSRFDLLVGFRYLDLQEESRADEVYGPLAVEGNNVAFNGDFVGLGNIIAVSDAFKAHNSFYGGQIGAKTVFNLGAWVIDVRYQLALGVTREELDIEGSSVRRSTQLGGFSEGVPGGMLAQVSNIGRRSSNSFAVVPSVELKLGYDFSSNLRVHAGYSFLYWSSVMRPGEQIDRIIDPALVPTFEAFVPGTISNRPMAPANKSDFWAQGVNFGFEVRY